MSSVEGEIGKIKRKRRKLSKQDKELYDLERSLLEFSLQNHNLHYQLHYYAVELDKMRIGRKTHETYVC